MNARVSEGPVRDVPRTGQGIQHSQYGRGRSGKADQKRSVCHMRQEISAMLHSGRSPGTAVAGVSEGRGLLMDRQGEPRFRGSRIRLVLPSRSPADLVRYGKPACDKAADNHSGLSTTRQQQRRVPHASPLLACVGSSGQSGNRLATRESVKAAWPPSGNRLTLLRREPER